MNKTIGGAPCEGKPRGGRACAPLPAVDGADKAAAPLV